MKASLTLLIRFSLFASLALFASCRRGPDASDHLDPDLDGIGLDDGTWGQPFGDPLDDDLSRPDIFTSGQQVATAIAPVYFAFDSYRIAPGEEYKVQQAVDHLRNNPSHVVVIEGHTDERGSREYNLALGERRALAVRESVLAHGISNERVQTLSYGEEQPAVQGFDESAWSQNRRAEFRFLR